MRITNTPFDVHYPCTDNLRCTKLNKRNNINKNNFVANTVVFSGNLKPHFGIFKSLLLAATTFLCSCIGTHQVTKSSTLSKSLEVAASSPVLPQNTKNVQTYLTNISDYMLLDKKGEIKLIFPIDTIRTQDNKTYIIEDKKVPAKVFQMGNEYWVSAAANIIEKSTGKYPTESHWGKNIEIVIDGKISNFIKKNKSAKKESHSEGTHLPLSENIHFKYDIDKIFKGATIFHKNKCYTPKKCPPNDYSLTKMDYSKGN